MSFYTLLTTIGAARLANAQATSTTVDLVELAVGDGEDGAAYNPTEAQTELMNEVWRGDINQIYVHAENANWIVIEAVVPEEVGGWFVREVGIFDDAGNMIAIGKYPDTYKPELAEGSAKDLYIRMILQISNTGDVELKIDPAIVLATRKYADDKMIAHLAAADPHTQYAVPDATTEIKGKVELATVAEAKAGTDTARAVTPAGLAGALDALQTRDLLERLLSAIGDSSTNPSLGMDPETYEDTSKIDGGESSGYVHDAAGDFIHNPGITVTPSSAGIWSGKTGSFTFSGDDVLGNSGADYSIWTTASYDGPVEVDFTWTGADGFVSFVDTAGDGDLNPDNSRQVATTTGKTWTVRWYLAGADLLVYDYGNTSGNIGGEDAIYATSPIGQPCKLKVAADGTVTFEIDGVVAHTFAVSATGKTVRFSIGCPNTAIDLDDLSITAGGDPENFTLVSTAFEAWAEPTKGAWLGLVKPVDAITYGADYLVDLSKDDGGTWEAVAISKIGETVINVNGAPTTVDAVYGDLTFAASGDQTIRTRTRGANNKECQSHGAIRRVE